VCPKSPVEFEFDEEAMEKLFVGPDYKEDYKILVQNVRNFNENIPPLVNAYMNLSPSMKTFGTISNEKFGNVLETGIILTIKDIYNAKVDRHIETYIKTKDDDDSWPAVK
jgi:hypothetical protein